MSYSTNSLHPRFELTILASYRCSRFHSFDEGFIRLDSFEALRSPRISDVRFLVQLDRCELGSSPFPRSFLLRKLISNPLAFSSSAANPKCSDSLLRQYLQPRSSGGRGTTGSRLEVAFSIQTLRNGLTNDSLLSRSISKSHPLLVSTQARRSLTAVDADNSGGKDYLVLTEPLLHRLKTKEVDVDLIRVQKMDDGEHCDFFWYVLTLFRLSIVD